MEIGSERVFAARQSKEIAEINSYRYINYNSLDNKKLKEVSREFESLFINQLFKAMRSTVQKSDWLNGGLKQEIFEDMLYNEYSRIISHAGGIGLGDMVYKYLLTTRSGGTKTP